MKTIKSLAAILSIGLELAIQVQGQSFLTNGLIAYYPFNGNANDESGKGNNGLALGATLTTDRLGNASRAYALNGQNGYISVPSQPYLNLSDSDFTISCWAVADTDSNWVLLSKSNGGFLQQKWAFGKVPNEPSGALVFHIVDQAGRVFWYSPAQFHPKPDIWYHFLVKRTGQQYAIYINGKLASSEASTVPPPPGILAPLNLGQIESLGWLNGNIDDVRIYGRALSEAEIQQLYALEAGVQCTLIKAVKPSFHNVVPGLNYQMQVSLDLVNWTNQGTAFTALTTTMIYPQYWDVDNWNQLFFRLQVAP